MNALDYLLKVNLYGLLFAASYWLLLRRHTFFCLNRIYLLVSAVLSLALPLVSLPTQTVETLPVQVPVGLITLPVTSVSMTPVEAVFIPVQPDWEQIGLIVYGLVALGFVFSFLARIRRLLRLIHRSPRQIRKDYVFVQPNDPTMPTFSFFQYIILNPIDTHNDLIIQHELVHVRQWHSADVVGMELARALFWACPALWLINHLLRQIHEFLADKPANQPTEYARFLVAYSFGTQASLSGSDALTNSFFNPSLLKQRIVMLHRKATTRWALSKYALVLPLAFGLLAMTTAREEIASVVNKVTDETITVSGRVTSREGKPLPGANVVVANTGKGTPTDQNGFYKLSNVAGSAMLAYSHMGYRTDILRLSALSHRAKEHRLTLSPKLMPNLQEELPAMGATAAYKAIKPNLKMPIRTPPSSEMINGKIYTAVEEPAVFPTGIPGLMQYVAHHLQYPPKAKIAGIQGDVFVIFTVLPTGAIGEVKVNKNIERIGGGCEEEAVRIVSQMPKWIPARQNNKLVAIRYQIPIRFTLEKKEDKRTGQVDPPTFKPTDSSIGEFPTIRDVNYSNHPRLTMTKVPAGSFRADTTLILNSEKKTSVIIDNSKNERFAIYNDLKTGGPAFTDSNSTVRIRNNRRPLSQFGVEPLYILNGIQISADAFEKLNAYSIESINLVKSSAAITAYGDKAKDGVVIITTKKK